MDDKKKKQEELNSLIGKKELAKVGNWYPDLYSQMSYSIADLQKEKQAVFDEIKGLYESQGDLMVIEILKSIYLSFIDRFMDGNGNLGDADEEVSFTRRKLFDFAGDIYAKIEAASYLKSALGHFHRIRDLESRIELAKKGILL